MFAPGPGLQKAIGMAANPIQAALAKVPNKAELFKRLGTTAEAVESVIPRVETKVELTVWGQPHAKKTDLLWFAYAIVFGLLKRRKAQGVGQLLPPSSLVLAHFSLHEKVVHVEVAYSASPLMNLVNGLAGQVRAQAEGDKIADAFPVFVGVPETIVAGKFDGTNWLERRILGQGPSLPAAGTVVLTDQPTLASPAPGGDKIARGTLEGLIWESLIHPPHLNDYSKEKLLEEDLPAIRQPGSSGAYFSGKEGVPTPLESGADMPKWKKFWQDRGRTTPKFAG